MKYRAKCKDCNFKKAWTEDEVKANKEASKHMSEHEGHEAIVIMKQRRRWFFFVFM